MIIVLIGPQGSGKGTQAKIISERLNIPHISIGDLFRSLKGKLKKEVDYYINRGELVPDELTINLLKKVISKKECEKGFILDGFPRNINQAKMLQEIVKVDLVILIDIEDELAIKRILSRVSCKKCGAVYNLLTNPPKKEMTCDVCGEMLYKRTDDNIESIKKRLENYYKETEPVLSFYKDKLIVVDGSQEIEKIAEEILKKLGC